MCYQVNAQCADAEMQEGQSLEQDLEKQDGSMKQSEHTGSTRVNEPQHTTGDT